MPTVKEDATILLVEDDHGHARLIEKNLRRHSVSNNIVILNNGKDAEDFIFKKGEYEGVNRPENLIVFLDLNLPVVNGYDVLKKIKNNEATKNMPVIILTSLLDPHEVARCYELGCNALIAKPVEPEEFADAIKKLGQFLSIVKVSGDE